MVSIIVPTLNEELKVEGLLGHLEALPGEHEVVVVDGGSSDRTVALIAGRVRLIVGERGRGPQLNVGAGAARGETLLFLHADSRLPEGAVETVERALADPSVVGGHFQVRFGGEGPINAAFEALYGWLRRVGFVYGDAALFVRREVFYRLGGFRPYPIMEDYEFYRRLRGQGRVLGLPLAVNASARRWQRQGAFLTVGSWLAIQGLYHLGVSPSRLAALYRPQR